MGKRLISQRRGRGTPTYRSPSHRFKGMAVHPRITEEPLKGTVNDIIKCPGHSAPLIEIAYSSGDVIYNIAPEGIKVGDVIEASSEEVSTGNILELGKIPEGTSIFNIEAKPGDGGKFVRTTGTFAKVVAHNPSGVSVVMPSKRIKEFNPKCRAAIGVVAGSGRVEKPFVKAGNKYYKMKAKNKLYPRTSGISMNAVDHPFGTSRSSKKGKPDIARKHAPPGAKVGKIRPRRTGRKKGSKA